MQDDLQEKIRAVWAKLSGCPDGFDTDGVKVSISDHDVAPIGWIGSVSLGDSAVVAVRPGDSWAVEDVTAAKLSLDDFSDRNAVEMVFGPMEDTLGPAILAFALTVSEVEGSVHEVVGPLLSTDARVRAVTRAATAEEVEESAIDDLSSGLFVALDKDERPVAASGFTPVLDTLAHIGVLTAADVRGNGFGRQAAAAAIAHAQQVELIPQWRAATTNTASVALAERLGLTMLGRQFSFRLAARPWS